MHKCVKLAWWLRTNPKPYTSTVRHGPNTAKNSGVDPPPSMLVKTAISRPRNQSLSFPSPYQYILSWKIRYPLPAGTFESMIFLFPFVWIWTRCLEVSTTLRTKFDWGFIATPDASKQLVMEVIFTQLMGDRKRQTHKICHGILFRPVGCSSLCFLPGGESRCSQTHGFSPIKKSSGFLLKQKRRPFARQTHGIFGILPAGLTLNQPRICGRWSSVTNSDCTWWPNLRFLLSKSKGTPQSHISPCRNSLLL